MTGVARLAAERGIAQFIDLGAGLPTRPSVHEAARAVYPRARVAYVDNDPVVVSVTPGRCWPPARRAGGRRVPAAELPADLVSSTRGRPGVRTASRRCPAREPGAAEIAAAPRRLAAGARWPLFAHTTGTREQPSVRAATTARFRYQHRAPGPGSATDCAR